jgi:hypothetical protein
MFKKFSSLFNKPEKAEAPTPFVCSCCGESITELPAIGYSEPHHYGALSDDEKKYIAELTSDSCIIRYKDQTDYLYEPFCFRKS